MEVKQLLSLTNGGSVLIGWKPTLCGGGSGSCKSTVFCLLFDAQGNLLLSKTYYTGISFSRPVGVATSDGGFAFFGRLYDSASKRYKGGLIVKCTRYGDVTWTKKLVSERYSSFDPQFMTENSDGDLLLTYGVKNNIYYSSKMQIIKLSPQGKLLWYSTINTELNYGDFYYPTSLIEKDNDFYIGGIINCQDLQGILTATILKINKQGKVIYFKMMNPYPALMTSNSVYNIFLSNKQLYIYGYYSNSQTDSQYFLRITDTTVFAYGDAIGGVSLFDFQQYIRKYKVLFPLNFRQLTNFNKDGSIVQGYGFHDSVIIRKYDTLGRICPDFIPPAVDTTTRKKLFTIYNKSYRILKDSVYLQDTVIQDSTIFLPGTILCTGSASFNNDINKPGNASGTFSKAVIYPNPAKNLLHISGLNSSIESHLIVINTQGKIMDRTSVKANTCDLNISHLQKGTYYLRISEPANSRSYLFIKE